MEAASIVTVDHPSNDKLIPDMSRMVSRGVWGICCEAALVPPFIPSLSYFHAKFFHQSFVNFVVHIVGLRIGQCPFEAAIVDAIAHTPPSRLRMRKLVHQFDILDYVAGHAAHNFHHIVLMKVVNVCLGIAPGGR